MSDNEEYEFMLEVWRGKRQAFTESDCVEHKAPFDIKNVLLAKGTVQDLANVLIYWQDRSLYCFMQFCNSIWSHRKTDIAGIIRLADPKITNAEADQQLHYRLRNQGSGIPGYRSVKECKTDEGTITVYLH